MGNVVEMLLLEGATGEEDGIPCDYTGPVVRAWFFVLDPVGLLLNVEHDRSTQAGRRSIEYRLAWAHPRAVRMVMFSEPWDLRRGDGEVQSCQ